MHDVNIGSMNQACLHPQMGNQKSSRLMRTCLPETAASECIGHDCKFANSWALRMSKHVWPDHVHLRNSLSVMVVDYLAGLAQGSLDAVGCSLAGQGSRAGDISGMAAVTNHAGGDASLLQMCLPAAHKVSALHICPPSMLVLQKTGHTSCEQLHYVVPIYVGVCALSYRFAIYHSLCCRRQGDPPVSFFITLCPCLQASTPWPRVNISGTSYTRREALHDGISLGCVMRPPCDTSAGTLKRIYAKLEII